MKYAAFASHNIVPRALPPNSSNRYYYYSLREKTMRLCDENLICSINTADSFSIHSVFIGNVSISRISRHIIYRDRCLRLFKFTRLVGAPWGERPSVAVVWGKWQETTGADKDSRFDGPRQTSVTLLTPDCILICDSAWQPLARRYAAPRADD